jgi:hypothetical protein
MHERRVSDTEGKSGEMTQRVGSEVRQLKSTSDKL